MTVQEWLTLEFERLRELGRINRVSRDAGMDAANFHHWAEHSLTVLDTHRTLDGPSQPERTSDD